MKRRHMVPPLFAVYLVGVFAAAPLAAAHGNDPPPQQDELTLLKEQAGKGDADAQNRLGFAFKNGLKGAARNEAEAILWFTKAADRGFGAAQNNLCSLYRDHLQLASGIRPPDGAPLDQIVPAVGTREDADGAAKWCRAAAQQGFVESQVALGTLLGRGVNDADGAEVARPDAEQAYFWLFMRRKDAFRDAVAAKITPERRAEIEAESREWKPTRASP